MTNTNNSKLTPFLKQLFVLIIITTLLYIVGKSLSSFINGLLGALALHIIFRKFHDRLKNKKYLNASKAALIIMLLSFITILIPIIYLSFSLVNGIQDFLIHYENIIISLNAYVESLELKTGIDIINKENIKIATQKLSSFLPSIFNSTAGVLSEIAVLYFTLYFTLTEKEKIESWIRDILPFSEEDNQLILTKLKDSTISNITSIPLIGIAQGAVSFIIYLICGIDNAFSWALITGIFSLVPMVGTALIWLPLSLYLIIFGDLLHGGIILISGIVIITNIDNVMRLTVLKKLNNTHPLFMIFGIIIGLNTIGFMGIVFGPLIISYLFILIDLYRLEYGSGNSIQNTNNQHNE